MTLALLDLEAGISNEEADVIGEFDEPGNPRIFVRMLMKKGNFS